MCDRSLFAAMTAGGGQYYPPTYEKDGFIHATLDPKFLLEVGNHFYQGVTGDWICVLLNPALLGGKIVYEAAAPVGEIEAVEVDGAPKFPHIYGGIPGKAVIATYAIQRGKGGEFLSIPGLC